MNGLLSRLETHAQVESPVELVQAYRLGVSQCGTDVTERVDHRIDLGVRQRRAGRCVVDLGVSRRALGLRPVQRIDQRRRVDAGPDRVLEPADPGLGVQHPPLGGLLPARVPLVGLRVRTCDRLVGSGLLRRYDDPSDRRNLVLALTVAGQQLVDGINAERREAIEDLLASMPAPSRRSLSSALLAFAGAAGATDDSAGAWVLGWTTEQPVGTPIGHLHPR
jgi:hypothetical protein